MFDQHKIEDLAASQQIKSLDISMFDDGDVFNLVLQRSEVLFDFDKPGALIRAFTNGDRAPLLAAIQGKQDVIIHRTLAVLRAEYEALKPVLSKLNMTRIADIGCGYAFFDHFAHTDFGCDVVLIDIEDNDSTHFGFAQNAAAYTSLDKAKAFCVANGAPSDKITTINPNDQELSAIENVDVAVSFLSCGFHYPVSTYDAFFRTQVSQTGALILDVRDARASDQIDALVQIGQVSRLWKGEKWQRVVVKKPIFSEEK